MTAALVPIGANLEDTGFTLEGRVLCGDDACIGTIGPDKRCKLCGRPYEGDAEVGSGGAPPAGTDDGAGTARSDADDAPAEAEPAATAGTEVSGLRSCCPDEACVGIIGPNGVCGICGKKKTT
jgi:hypothetical protein